MCVQLGTESTARKALETRGASESVETWPTSQMPGRIALDTASVEERAKKEPASIATADIAYACRKTSSTRAGVEIGFGSSRRRLSEAGYSSRIIIPQPAISVPFAFRSNPRISTLATASRTTVATKRNTSRERRCSCVGLAARATLSTSRPPVRTGSGTQRVFRSGRSDDPLRLRGSVGRPSRSRSKARGRLDQAGPSCPRLSRCRLAPAGRGPGDDGIVPMPFVPAFAAVGRLLMGGRHSRCTLARMRNRVNSRPVAI